MAEYRRNTCSRPGCCQSPAPGPSCPLPMPVEQVCTEKTDLERFPVAMYYVPRQTWCEPYKLEQGLKIGTIFPDLNKPFLGIRKGGCCR